MKKWIIAALFLLAVPAVSFGQQVSMRMLAAEEMFVYGQAIFNRGDYVEAANVFRHILKILPSHEGAISYAVELNKKGQHIDIPVQPLKPAQKHEVKKAAKPQEQAAPQAPIDPNGDLKQKIVQADKTIGQLQKDITAINTQITQGEKEFQKDKNQIK